MDLDAIVKQATQIAIEMVPKVAGAIVLWLAGRWLIRLALGGVGRALSRQGVDPTVARYAQTSLGVVLNVALIVALLGFFGVETTTFAALVAAGGVAIGVAWGGLLANFAAGAFLIVLRPFKVGDMVSAGGVTGQVEAIGLFGTTINTPDNVLTIVGNNKIFSDTIQNYSANPYRRVDLVATINNATIRRFSCSGRGSGAFRTCWLRPSRRSMCSNSRLPGRCSVCAPSAAPSITGRCTSMPIARSVKHSRMRGSLLRCRRSPSRRPSTDARRRSIPVSSRLQPALASFSKQAPRVCRVTARPPLPRQER
jgi:small conductance mechanosensitive channel